MSSRPLKSVVLEYRKAKVKSTKIALEGITSWYMISDGPWNLRNTVRYACSLTKRRARWIGPVSESPANLQSAAVSTEYPLAGDQDTDTGVFLNYYTARLKPL